MYFPGTYPDPVVLDGPTFFTSGVYYFEVRVKGGASVVVGGGATPGCTTDQEAVFYAENVPGTHNMTGLGATWVLGAAGRVIVTNDAAVSLKFNKRYVEESDLGGLPSADVSIMTVNGVAGGVDYVTSDLEVPLSLAGAGSVPATSQGYVPSVLTPGWSAVGAPTASPAIPARPTVTAGPGVARVAWASNTDRGAGHQPTPSLQVRTGQRAQWWLRPSDRQDLRVTSVRSLRPLRTRSVSLRATPWATEPHLRPAPP